ncbi:hypothetical protein RHGRI_031551 [Rhododendron griersonianum]|uniref:Uncharacterized protein n=1 Tax=Rhododendron griersonianum TaxID=479676 RepID=A0AAV6IBF1_9ERIC|nr:hypothetical protein RHGRI_031551 [Rhododendron griersonianum]
MQGVVEKAVKKKIEKKKKTLPKEKAKDVEEIMVDYVFGTQESVVNASGDFFSLTGHDSGLDRDKVDFGVVGGGSRWWCGVRWLSCSSVLVVSGSGGASCSGMVGPFFGAVTGAYFPNSSDGGNSGPSLSR